MRYPCESLVRFARWLEPSTQSRQLAATDEACFIQIYTALPDRAVEAWEGTIALLACFLVTLGPKVLTHPL